MVAGHIAAICLIAYIFYVSGYRTGYWDHNDYMLTESMLLAEEREIAKLPEWGLKSGLKKSFLKNQYADNK